MRGRGEAEGTRALSLFFRRWLLGLLPPPSCLLGPYVSLLTYWFPPIISFFLEPGFLWFSLHHCCFPPSFLFFIICFCSFLCLVSPLLALQIPVPFHLFSFPFVLTRRAGLPSLAPSRVAAPVRTHPTLRRLPSVPIVVKRGSIIGRLARRSILVRTSKGFKSKGKKKVSGRVVV